MQEYNMNPGGNQEKNPTKIIVNYLPSSMSQEDVCSLFSSVGELESCNVIRNKITGESLEYCFVKYKRPEDAENAIDKLNGLKLHNKTIKVALARPSSDAIKKSNLYISGLPKNMTEQDLENLFSPYGHIISSRILREDSLCQTFPGTGENVSSLSKGVGFVRFDQRAEAELAIQELDETVPKGFRRPITVKFAKCLIKHNTATFRAQAAFVASAGFPAAQRFEGPVRHPIRRFGPSSLAKNFPGHPAQPGYTIHPCNNFPCNPMVPGNPILLSHTMQPGYAVLPENETMPGNLSHPYHPHMTNLMLPGNMTFLGNSTPSGNITLRGNMLMPAPGNLAFPGNYTPPNNPTNGGWCIFVNNLVPTAEDSSLWQMFGPFGAVQSVEIVRDWQTNQSMGFGFVTMTNYEEAVIAIDSLNGIKVGDRALLVCFKSNKNKNTTVESSPSVPSFEC